MKRQGMQWEKKTICRGILERKTKRKSAKLTKVTARIEEMQSNNRNKNNRSNNWTKNEAAEEDGKNLKCRRLQPLQHKKKVAVLTIVVINNFVGHDKV